MRNHTQISDILLESASCHCPTVFWKYRESEFTLEQISSPMIDKSTRANILAMYFAPLCCAPLCCAVLRCVVLHCAPLCCATLLCCARCCVVLRCCVVPVVLCSVVLCYIVLYSVVLCSIVLSRKKFISDLHMNIEGHFWGLPVASPMTSSPWKYFFLHNLGRSFHIWWQIEAALSGLDFPKWPPDWCQNNFWTRKISNYVSLLKDAQYQGLHFELLIDVLSIKIDGVMAI